MMETQLPEDRKLARAKKRIKEIKCFYRHLTIYLLVNLFLTFITQNFDVTIRLFEGLEFGNSGSNSVFVQHPVWYIWGFFLLVDAIKVFIFPSVMGKSWKDKKIEKYMNDKNIQE
ncbi:MAG: 2TM domain-containing protein [Flavobacteriaceae bacterium]